MAMPDRRNAPVFAAAAAFVLVLVFGKLIDSPSSIPSPNPSGSPTPTATSSPSPKASHTGGHVATPTTPTTPTTTTTLTPLTVEVTEQPGATSGVQVLDIQAQVRAEKRNATPVNGTLIPELNSTSLQWITQPLATGTYQVCLQTPAGTKFVGPNVDVKPGSACMTVHLVPDSPPVVFTLAQATP